MTVRRFCFYCPLALTLRTGLRNHEAARKLRNDLLAVTCRTHLRTCNLCHKNSMGSPGPPPEPGACPSSLSADCAASISRTKGQLESWPIPQCATLRLPSARGKLWGTMLRHSVTNIFRAPNVSAVTARDEVDEPVFHRPTFRQWNTILETGHSAIRMFSYRVALKPSCR